MERAQGTAAERPLGSVASMVDGLLVRLEDEPDDADGWILLARSYQQLYLWEASERAYVRAIQIIEGSRGRDDPQIADILGQLLRVASELGQPKRVRSYGLRALNILSKTEGADPTKAAWIHSSPVTTCESVSRTGGDSC